NGARKAGRRGSLVKPVPEMPAATAAMHFLPDDAESVVGVGLHCAVDQSVEARPARSRVELGLGGKQRQIAARASEGAFAVLVVARAGEGTLCVLLTQHGVLLRREQLPPFLRSMGDLERLGGGVRAAAPPQAGKAGGSENGETEGPQSNLASRHDIWILRACLHAAIQLARTEDHVQVSNQPREVTCAEGMTISQRTPLGGKESLTLPSSALPTTVSIIALPKPERCGGMTGGPPRSCQTSLSFDASSQNCH